MNPQAMLKLLLGASEGDVMYAIYSDYANKLQNISTGKGFDIDEDGYVPKSYENIAEYVGIQASAVKRAIERLVERGLLQKQPGNAETNNIPLYKPELRSEVFIKIAKERLENLTTDRLDRPLNEKCIPQIIETLEKDQYVLVALGLVKSSHKSNPPEEQDLYTIVEYFKFWYKQMYNKDYNPSDFEIKKLQETINNYSMEQWQGMILIFIEKYNERWKSDKYPKPTILGLAQDWLIEQVYDIYEEEKDLNAIVWNFKCWYKHMYNRDYNPNDNEIKRLRNIINNYSIKQWGEMIPIFIENYDYTKWKSDKYPEPTIFGLTQDWILKQVYDMYEEVKVRYDEEEQQRQSQLKKCVSWNDL